MIDLLAYPYLAVSVALCGIAMILAFASGEHRRMVLTSGALAAPLALFSWQFIPEYWNPRVLGRYVTTVEDVLFSASVGVIVMALALAPFRRRVGPKATLLVRRYALCISLVVGLHTFLLYAVFDPSRVMYSAVAAVGVFAVWIWGSRRETLPISAVGFLTFPVFYFAVVKLYLLVFPSSAGDWVKMAQLPFDIGGVPAFELVWAAAWGATWPPFMWFVFDVKAKRPLAECSPAQGYDRGGVGMRGAS